MKWLEIIEFNLEGQRNFLEKDIESIIEKMKNGYDPKAVEVYSRVSEEIDYSIHLFHKSNSVKKSGSSFGTSLSSVLRKFGTIKHNVWV